MAELKPVPDKFNSYAGVDVGERFPSPDLRTGAFKARSQVERLVERATQHFKQECAKHQQNPDLSYRRYDDKQQSKHKAIAQAGRKYQERIQKIQKASDRQLKRLDIRQQTAKIFSDIKRVEPKNDQERRINRATSRIDGDFKRSQANLLSEHQRQEKRLLKSYEYLKQEHEDRGQQIKNREKARHGNIEQKQANMTAAMHKRHNSFTGKLAAKTTAGRSRQENERQALVERGLSAKANAATHFEALTNRHQQQERQDRQFIADIVRIFRADNHETRQMHAEIHQQTRDIKIEVQAQHMHAAEERSLRQSMTHEFNQTPEKV